MFHTFHMYNNFYIKLDNLKIKNWHKRINILHIVCLFLIIAIALNFVLNIKSDIDVIGDNNAPTIWLNFWGTYLAAIAAFCVIFQNHKHKLQEEERIQNDRFVNYIVRQAENNPYIKFTAIINEILEYKNSAKSIWKKNDSIIAQYNMNLDELDAFILYLEIELLSVTPKEKSENIRKYAKNYKTLLHTITTAIGQTKQGLNKNKDELGCNNNIMEDLKRQNHQLYESTKLLLNNYPNETENLPQHQTID